jgi:serine/threonine protein phosphatase PrpC
MVRASNEDSYIADGGSRIFLVADGMGGHAAGEIASGIAASTVQEVFSAKTPDAEDIKDRVHFAVQQANTRVYETQRTESEYRGMGTTLTVLAFQENRYCLAHVGDSRAYLFRDNNLTQLTRDHSLVWPLFENGIISKDEIARQPQKHLVTRSVGTHADVEIDLQANTAMEGDIFLLCSDGLTDVLTDDAIEQILQKTGNEPQEISQALVQAANKGGGPDNITTVAVFLAPGE